uniref:Uncharacterized protein n=1 Tax=Octopus bimaculoides TaxID=37653 RepID=A0A0L8G5J0_OCTBM
MYIWLNISDEPVPNIMSYHRYCPTTHFSPFFKGFNSHQRNQTGWNILYKSKIIFLQ